MIAKDVPFFYSSSRFEFPSSLKFGVTWHPRNIEILWRSSVHFPFDVTPQISMVSFSRDVIGSSSVQGFLELIYDRQAV